MLLVEIKVCLKSGTLLYYAAGLTCWLNRTEQLSTVLKGETHFGLCQNLRIAANFASNFFLT